MQVVETTSPSGRPVMNFTHKILPGSCQIENYGNVFLFVNKVYLLIIILRLTDRDEAGQNGGLPRRNSQKSRRTSSFVRSENEGESFASNGTTVDPLMLFITLNSPYVSLEPMTEHLF